MRPTLCRATRMPRRISMWHQARPDDPSLPGPHWGIPSFVDIVERPIGKYKSPESNTFIGNAYDHVNKERFTMTSAQFTLVRLALLMSMVFGGGLLLLPDTSQAQ